MSTTVEISYAGGKKVNALIQDHLIPTDQSPECRRNSRSISRRNNKK